MLVASAILLKKNSLYTWQVGWEDYIEHKDYFFSILALEEKKRAAKRLQGLHACRFIVIRGLLRVAIGHLLRQPPDAVQFIYVQQKKPTVINSIGLEFNISHTRHKALYAFALHTPVGIDIEDINPNQFNIARLASRYFSIQENAQLTSLHPLLKGEAFIKGWVQKEAITKAYGLGLKMPFHQIEVNIQKGAPRLVHMHNTRFQHLNFLLYAITVEKGSYAVIAAQTDHKKLKLVCMDSVLNLACMKIISNSSRV